MALDLQLHQAVSPMMLDPSIILFVLGIGFFLANLRVMWQFVRFVRLRSSALVVWPGRRPPYYGFLVAIGAVLGVLIVYKLVVLQWPLEHVFGESMMLVYYGYAMPLNLKIGRGFYEDGIWADGGFVPYSTIGGLAWREGEQLTLVLIDRMRQFGRRLTVPQRHYGEVRRVLRDKIAAHDIHFTGKSLDISDHDERDVV